MIPPNHPDSTIRPDVANAAVRPGELDALLAAINSAIEALVAWDIAGFHSAVARQRAICDRLAGVPLSGSSSVRLSPESATTARKVRELNRVYDRLLQHSIQWTRTLHSIHEAGGHSFSDRASIHFRG